MRPGQPAPQEGRPRSRGGVFGALRHRDFCLLWSGSIISNVGNWMQQIAQAWLIYELTGSALLVGLNGLIRTLPFLVMSLYAGTVVDRVDRRKLLFWVEVAMLAVTVVLAGLIAGGQIQLWHIYLASVVYSLAGAFEIPTQQALLPYLIPAEDLMQAVSLNSLVRRGSQVIGPALGGVSVAAVGVAGTYFINAASFVLLLVMILLMRATNPRAAHTGRNPLRAIADGLSFVRHDSVIGPLLLMDCVMSVFGSYNAMLVVFAKDVFHMGAEGLGLLQSAPGVGTLVGTLLLSYLGDVRAKGRLIIFGGVLYGIAVIAFTATPWFPLALGFLAVAGMAEVTVGATRTTALQLLTRQDMLGRVMSLQAIATRGLGPVGGFEAGSLGTVVGVPLAIAMGVSVYIATTLGVARQIPAVRNLTTHGYSPPAGAGPRGRPPVGEVAVAQRPPLVER